MAGESKKKRSEKLIHKYTVEIRDQDTYEKKRAYRFSRLNVMIVVTSFAVILMICMTLIIAFTPIRQYFPGYLDANLTRKLLIMSLQLDSLEQELITRDQYILNFKKVVNQGEENYTARLNAAGQDSLMNGDVINPASELVASWVEEETSKTEKYQNIKLIRSKEDSLLRVQIESEDRFDLMFNNRRSIERSSNNDFSGVLFFTPLNGMITDTFCIAGKHYGIDIVAPKNEAVKATLGGTVILATWTSETGYVIGIQHDNNLLSIYKHNSVLLKKVGNQVSAGEVVAIVGDSGELTTGPHLHFELWHNGNPLNPGDYMVF